MEGSKERRSSSSPRVSALSPFPFGSPISRSEKSVLSPGKNSTLIVAERNNETQTSSVTQHVIRGKVRAKEVYGGPLVFGGNSSLRRHRLLSATPYEGAASRRYSRLPNRQPDPKPSTSNAPSPSTSKSTTPSSEDGMSSTARFILDTLERMSTPVRDAQKIPLIPRAEKRKQVMSELECSLQSQNATLSSSKRRRPNLSTPTRLTNNRTLLNGPPLRTLMSPVSASTPRAMKSARISTLSSPMSATPVSKLTTATPTSVSTPAFSSTKSPDTSHKVESKSGDVSPSNYQIPFSVPALGGGILNNKTETTKLNDRAPGTVSNLGKIRTKLGDKAINLDGPTQQADPLPAYLKNPVSSGLNLKQMPNISLGSFTAPSLSTPVVDSPTLSQKFPAITTSNSKDSQSSATTSLSKASSKTADTLPLSPDQKRSNSVVFSFSEPVIVCSRISEISSGMNGGTARFTFSDPVEVLPAGKTNELPRNNSTNHVGILPDLTFSASKLPKAPKMKTDIIPPLKSGSVLDILGIPGGNKLPDVTASAASKKTNSSLVSTFGSSSSWDSKFKVGQMPWT